MKCLGPVLALLTCILAQHGEAQGVRVQSGEHDGFTRLVVPISDETVWNIDQNQSRAIVTFEPSISSFDFGSVFDLIPRERVVGLQEVDGGFRIDLGCECRLIDYEFGDRFLVIDVSAADRSPENSVLNPNTASFLPPPSGPRAGIIDPGILFSENSIEAYGVQLSSFYPQEGAEVPALDPGLADDLSQEVSHVAAGGFLTPIEPSVAADSEEIVYDLQPNIEEGSPATDTNLPIVVHNGQDLFQNDPAMRSEQGCPNRDALAIAEWGGDGDFSSEISELRINLFDDRDQPRPSEIRRLVRFYIFYGFGREALAWLELLDDQDTLDIALAHFFDGNPDPLRDALRSSDGCSGPATMWRVAAGDIGATDELAERDVLVSEFLQLPTSLQDMLFGPISETLTLTGHTSTIVELEMDLDRGLASMGVDTSVETLPETSIRREEIAEALIAQISSDGAISSESLDAAEALWREIPDNSVRRDLFLALISAAAGQPDVPRALRLHAAGVEAAPELTEQSSYLLVLGFAELGNIAGLTAVATGTGFRMGQGQDVDEVRRVAASVLEEAGLPELALEFLFSIPSPRASADEAWISQLNEQLHVEHEPQTGPISPLVTPGPPEHAERIAELWENGAWSDLAEVAAGVEQEAIQELIDLQAVQQDFTAETFEEIEEVLQTSSETRAMVEQLLGTGTDSTR